MRYPITNMFSPRLLAVSLAAVCFFAWIGLSFAGDLDYVISIQFENDFFGGGSDRHFTHGTRLECLTQPIKWITDAADKIPWFSSEKALKNPKDALKARASFSIGQNIYTPEDISNPELILDDRPYAGWLYLGFGLVANQGMTCADSCPGGRRMGINCRGQCPKGFIWSTAI